MNGLAEQPRSSIMLILENRRSLLRKLGLSAVGGYTGLAVASGMGRPLRDTVGAGFFQNTEGPGDELVTIDHGRLIMAPYPNAIAFGGKLNKGVNLCFDPALLGQQTGLSETDFASVSNSIIAGCYSQFYSTLESDPAIYTSNMYLQMHVFGDANDAKTFVNLVNEPWMGSKVYSDEEAQVSGLNLQSYSATDTFQPTLTSNIFHGSMILDRTNVWELTISSVEEALDLNAVIDFAAVVRKESRNETSNPSWSTFARPANAVEVTIVPYVFDSTYVPLVDGTPDQQANRLRFVGDAVQAYNLNHLGVLSDGSEVFTSQYSLEFFDFVLAEFYYEQYEALMAELDGNSGTKRVFIDGAPEDFPLSIDIQRHYFYELAAGDAVIRGFGAMGVEESRVNIVELIPLALGEPGDLSDSAVTAGLYGEYRRIRDEMFPLEDHRNHRIWDLPRRSPTPRS